jgi:hypothetical protein
MNTLKSLLLVILIGLSQAGMAASLSFLAPEKEKTGTIQQLDFGANQMIVDGYRYRVAVDVQVEIRGSYGAFTMLQEGMKINMVYRVISESEREIITVEQLPDNSNLEGA